MGSGGALAGRDTKGSFDQLCQFMLGFGVFLKKNPLKKRFDKYQKILLNSLEPS